MVSPGVDRLDTQVAPKVIDKTRAAEVHPAARVLSPPVGVEFPFSTRPRGDGKSARRRAESRRPRLLASTPATCEIFPGAVSPDPPFGRAVSIPTARLFLFPPTKKHPGRDSPTRPGCHTRLPPGSVSPWYPPRGGDVDHNARACGVKGTGG